MSKFAFFESTHIDFSAINTVLILDRIQDTHNFGAICRTAVWTGVDMIAIPQKGNAPISEGCLKSSSGYLLEMKIISGKLKKIVEKLKETGFTIIGTVVNSNISPDKISSLISSKKVALLVGNERWGLSNYLKELADINVTIPLNKRVESLNVSVATAIILYELSKTKEKR